MIIYFSTFITGLNEVIKAALLQRINDVQIDLLVDGLVIYRTKLPKEEIRKIRFFNNSFISLRLYKSLGQNPINEMVHFAIKDNNVDSLIATHVMHRGISFRVIAKQESLISLDRNLLQRIENKIAKIKQLRVNKSYPDVEFWFIARREKFGIFGMRITRHTDYAKILQKGELRPELANIMCLMSEPNQQDIFLDPFSGSGAIPIERVTAFPYSQIIAVDDDKKRIDRLRQKVRKLHVKISVNRSDALNLTGVADEGIDKIVTDPPWGLHDGTELDLPVFYFDMMKEFYRILKKDGLLVILVAKKELFEDVMTKWQGKFILLQKYNTLVSGPKAAIYKIRKQ